MVSLSLKGLITAGILAAGLYIIVTYRKAFGETGQQLGTGASSLGSGIGTGLSGFAEGLKNIVLKPAEGLVGAISAVSSVVRTVEPNKPLSEGGIPFTNDAPFGGIEFGYSPSPPMSDPSIVTPATRERSDRQIPNPSNYTRLDRAVLSTPERRGVVGSGIGGSLETVRLYNIGGATRALTERGAAFLREKGQVVLASG